MVVNYIVMDIKLKNIYSGQCDTIRFIKDDQWMCPPLSANIILLRESTDTLHHWRRGHWQIAPNKRIHSGNEISSPRSLVTQREHRKLQINYIANDDHKWFGYLKQRVTLQRVPDPLAILHAANQPNTHWQEQGITHTIWSFTIFNFPASEDGHVDAEGTNKYNGYDHTCSVSENLTTLESLCMDTYR